MDRSIQKNLGTLEEQLEKLEGLFDRIDFSEEETRSDLVSPVLDELRSAIKNTSEIRASLEENLLWEKCFPLSAILDRLNAFLIGAANQRGSTVALAYRESGKIPLSMAQGLLPAILGVLQVVAERQAADDDTLRKRDNRLAAKAVILQLEGTSDFFSLKVMDDAANLGSEAMRFKKEFQKIRLRIAKFQGFCSFQTREPYGFEFRMKVPMPRSRTSALILRNRGKRYAVPLISVYDIVRGAAKDNISAQENGLHCLAHGELQVPICEIDAEEGIRPAEREFASDFAGGTFVILGAADFNLALAVDADPVRQLVRTESASAYLIAGSWHTDLALFNDGATAVLAPYIGGDILVDFQRKLQVRI